jgi:hypothetical protein
MSRSLIRPCASLHSGALFILIFISLKFAAQPPLFKTYHYIETYSQQAIDQMVAYKIPASVILAQAIYESSSGTSALAKKSNNHFGIKCHVGWGGDTIVKHDDTLNECFRRYDNIADSYNDHSLFLASRPRYAPLFSLGVTDYKGWCQGLKDAGYATSPSYAERLIKIIEDNHLNELDGTEYLPCEIILNRKDPGLRVSNYSALGFSLRDFSGSGLLWLDPNDVLIRSLDLILESNEGDGGIAEK